MYLLLAIYEIKTNMFLMSALDSRFQKVQQVFYITEVRHLQSHLNSAWLKVKPSGNLQRDV